MRRWTRWLIALAVLLTACASGPDVRESTAEPEPEWVSSYEEGCEDERSVVLLCEEGACGFFRCRDQQREQVVLARGGVIAPPAAPGGTPRRGWGVRPWMRRGSEPVLTFRLYPHSGPGPQRHVLPGPRYMLPAGRYVRHHIFPQARDLRTWFEQQGVGNIHKFTMVIPESIHQRIHGGGARGGRWNDAWRQYKENNPLASPAEIYRHAGELIFRFELAGPLLPYRSR